MTAAAVTIAMKYDGDDADADDDVCVEEMACVGAGLGGELQHSSDLHAIKYKQTNVNISDRPDEKGLDEKHEKRVMMEVQKEVNFCTPMQSLQTGQ